MKRVFVLIALCTVLFACGTTTTTGMDGVRYGMSQTEALNALKKAGDEIVSHSDSEIVAVGMWSMINQVRRKVLRFENGSLASIDYEPLDDSNAK